MNRILLLITLFVLSCSMHVVAQEYFYYYRGNKIPLTLNEDKVIISTYKDCNEIIQRIRSNVRCLFTINNQTFDIIVIPRSDFEKLVSQDFWEEDSKSVILSSSFFTQENEELFETPYLIVEIKDEEDSIAMSSYIEKYKLRYDTRWIFPWTSYYSFAVTPETGKGSLQCANEIYESGYFSSVQPDLTAAKPGYETSIRSVTISNSGSSIEKLYDLNGRKLASKPAKGIYIQNGKKRLGGTR